MACAVAGRLWEEEVGGRPPKTIIEPLDRKRKTPQTPLVKEVPEKRRRKRSPFRPWTPEPEKKDAVAPEECPESPAALTAVVPEAKRPPSPAQSGISAGSAGPQRRNYKNMTRERRIEANARERTRVHTISAAFENLRKAVPAYSHNQKLSKLAVLRVAASYILTLSRIIDKDYSADQSAPSLESCVESITSTIQMEGRLKKKKDDD